MEFSQKILNTIVRILPKYIKHVLWNNYERYILISPFVLINVLSYLKWNTNSQYKILIDISSVDYPERANRFELNYHLLSIKYNTRITIKTYTNEITPVESTSSIYSNACWSEREVMDMFGIFFMNNPDLRRILTDYGFEGHPLRKDFPLSGYYEIRYDDNHKYIVTEQLEVTQEFRLFDYTSPWEKK